jgi:hypothetical protein
LGSLQRCQTSYQGIHRSAALCRASARLHSSRRALYFAEEVLHLGSIHDGNTLAKRSRSARSKRPGVAAGRVGAQPGRAGSSRRCVGPAGEHLGDDGAGRGRPILADHGGSRAGPRWVRTASGTAGPRRARAVMAGMPHSQVTPRSPLRPRNVEPHDGGFEPLLRHQPVKRSASGSSNGRAASLQRVNAGPGGHRRDRRATRRCPTHGQHVALPPPPHPRPP